MASYAGFYVTRKAWTDWLRSNLTYNYTEHSLNHTNAQMEIEDALRRKRMSKLFMVEVVPVPPSEQVEYGNIAKTIMITRVIRKRHGYIAQRPDSLVDKMGQEILRNQIGLEVEEWRTMWYNKDSYKPPYEAEFLEPRDEG
ncbi:hypothetical protein RSOLAG22IIIB_12989 [Rhizoctonia solani]|uniref:Uncharacterized protein n=1 Tax=Rhizoctonia solani TaxID=456999 RepID=A0A0K6GHE5_9AGAM|nr:hypothetical protein RSOLAG22IIIB_12989 [Rhizoctonia solani]